MKIKILSFILDENGYVLDGSSGSEIGSKILMIIPADTCVSESLLETNVSVIVTNPMKNSKEPGLSSDAETTVRFLIEKEDKIPIIESVIPDVVTVEGGETVTIKGSNFLQDVKVFIDGREVSGINREGDGKTITFQAPPGREGRTQLQVMNPDGGIAIRDFQYVTTYTDPSITDFSPKAGNTGTLVLVKGDNFLPPDPTATTTEIHKLISTRILLQNRDINEYNIDPDSKRIKLQYYAPPEKEISGQFIRDEILSIEEAVDGRKYLRMADYWHSVLFSNDLGKFYTLRQDTNGNTILSDGVKNTYSINVKADNGEYKIFASKEGSSDYPIEIKTEEINGQDVTCLLIKESPEVRLYMQTLYKVDNKGIITGNNVKVIDKNQIIFKVPILTLGDGYYDLTY